MVKNTPIVSDLESLMDFRIDPFISPSVTPKVICETAGYYPFDQFLNHVDSSIFVIEKAKLVGFNVPVGQMFLELGRKIVGYHQANQFIGDIIHRVRISPQWHICIPFGGISGDGNDLDVGIYCDVRHLRRMVACLIMKFFPDTSHYSTFMSTQMNLFFSTIYLNHSREYSMFQFLHPIFYDSEARIKFINVIKEYSFECKNLYLTLDLDSSPYKVSKWQKKVKSASMKIYSDIFEGGMKKHRFYSKSGGLPLYIRDVHYHFSKNGMHEDADRQLNEWFPGICAKVLDALIRTLHGTWATATNDDKLFTKYLTGVPYGFAPTAPPS